MSRTWRAWLVLLGLVTAGRAETVWRVEAEAPEVTRNGPLLVVADPAASGGQAVRVPAEGAPAFNMVCLPLPDQATPGRYRVRLRLRYEGALGLGRAVRVDVAPGDEPLTNYAHGVAYAQYLSPRTGYADYVLTTDWTEPRRRPTIWLRWTGQGGQPTAWLDAFELTRLADLPPLVITAVVPNKLRYREGEAGTVSVTVRNLIDQPRTASLGVQLTGGLEDPAALPGQEISLAAGAAGEVAVRLPALSGRYGYAVTATVAMAGQVLDRREEYLCVHDSPYAVYAGNRDVEPPLGYGPWHWLVVDCGPSDDEIDQGVHWARAEYTTCCEVYAWSPGDVFGLAPDEPFWFRGTQSAWLTSKRVLQRLIGGLRRHGIGVIGYLNAAATGEPALRTMRRHPEWFAYSQRSGDTDTYSVGEIQRQRAWLAGFDRARYRAEGDPSAPGFQGTPAEWQRLRAFWEAQAKAANSPTAMVGYFTANCRRPEVVEAIADQVIASARMFGWDGLRWDCGHLNTGTLWGDYRTLYDFSGAPLAMTPDEMVAQTVANQQAFKRRIRQAVPGYVFGTNYGSLQETATYPAMTDELCRDGGWMLDEVASDYQQPQSPYHTWDRYYAVMCDSAEVVTRRGGHYHPYGPNRYGSTHQADRLYDTIFRLAGHGHPFMPYYNSCLPAGNYAQFAVRFGRFLFDPAMRRVEPAATVARVDAPQRLWWEKSVRRLMDGGSEYRIVHLINPPVTTDLETNREERLPEPVRGVKVAVAPPADKRQVRAWLLTAESDQLTDPPGPRAVPLAVSSGAWPSVTVPQVRYWNLVVWRFD